MCGKRTYSGHTAWPVPRALVSVGRHGGGGGLAGNGCRDWSAGELTDHDAAGAKADGCKLDEADLGGDAAEPGDDGALATGALLVDLGEQGVGRVRDDRGGDTGDETWLRESGGPSGCKHQSAPDEHGHYAERVPRRVGWRSAEKMGNGSKIIGPKLSVEVAVPEPIETPRFWLPERSLEVLPIEA